MVATDRNAAPLERSDRPAGPAAAVKLSDLTADERREVSAALSGRRAGSRAHRATTDHARRKSVRVAATRKGAGSASRRSLTTRTDRYECGTCGARFRFYAPAERHADTHGGARLEITL